MMATRVSARIFSPLLIVFQDQRVDGYCKRLHSGADVAEPAGSHATAAPRMPRGWDSLKLKGSSPENGDATELAGQIDHQSDHSQCHAAHHVPIDSSRRRVRCPKGPYQAARGKGMDSTREDRCEHEQGHWFSSSGRGDHPSHLWHQHGGFRGVVLLEVLHRETHRQGRLVDQRRRGGDRRRCLARGPGWKAHMTPGSRRGMNPSETPSEAQIAPSRRCSERSSRSSGKSSSCGARGTGWSPQASSTYGQCTKNGGALQLLFSQSSSSDL